ncbi:hypothetical protein N9J72_00995 [Candidatus Gracilibacteria bacterium]|nr:hypothetical protein [Candidatus Gracilibacteria bacterium]
MPPNNPYIEIVKQDPDIFTNTENIYAHQGKWAEYFGNDNPVVLEIGTGMGNFFGKQVGEDQDKNFIGMEIRYKRLFQTAEKSRKARTLQPLSFSKGEDSGVDSKKGDNKNNFLLLKDFGQNIDKIFSHGEISETYIFFPDPWANKDRQKKHRIMLTPFLEKLFHVTKTGGKVFFKTDHQEYFDSSIDIIEKQGIWKIEQKTHNYENSEIFDVKNITEFEGFYRGEKTAINYLELVKA